MDSRHASSVSGSRGRGMRGLHKGALITVLILLIATVLGMILAFRLPVLQLQGDAMAPLLPKGSVVVAVKEDGTNAAGDIVAIQHQGKLVVRRVIATGGQSVVVAPDGSVSVDGKPLDEPYVHNSSTEPRTLTLTVPEGQLFVLGDNREESVDSRDESVGCIPQSEVYASVRLCVWPITNLSLF